MKDDGATLESLAEDVDECGGFMSETTSDDEIEVGENDAVLNDQAAIAAGSVELKGGTTEPTEDTSTEEPAAEPDSILQPRRIADYYRKAKHKAEKKKAEKKKRKKKRKKRKKMEQTEEGPYPVSVIPGIGTEIEETFLFGSEIASAPGYRYLLQSSKISEQIRNFQGSVTDTRLKLELNRESGVFFGMYERDGFYIGKSSRMDGHICVIGESGRGKTESIVKPTMLTYQDGSAIVFDFKDDLYSHWLGTSKFLGKRCRVFRLGNPDGCSCHYDPLAVLKQDDSANIVPAADILAQTLIPLPEGDKDPVWIKTAQIFLTGVIIYYSGLEFDFPEIMSMVVNTPTTQVIKEIMDADADDDDDNDYTSRAKIFINKLTDVDQKVLDNIGMELSQLAIFAADMDVMKLLTPEKGCEMLDWYEISTSTEPIDVIISVPESKLDYYKPLLRLMGNQLINVLEQRPQRTFDRGTELPPILVLMDEFARLGRFPSITNGLMTLRSAGVTFAIFIQSIASLDEVYGHTTARVILDNCTFKVILGASDVESQQYCSNLVGSVETLRASINESCNMFTGQVTGYNRSISTTREPIIYPHEFGTLSDVVIVSPEGYVRVRKVPYYENKLLFKQLALLPRYKRYEKEYDHTHAISALPERSNHV